MPARKAHPPRQVCVSQPIKKADGDQRNSIEISIADMEEAQL